MSNIINVNNVNSTSEFSQPLVLDSFCNHDVDFIQTVVENGINYICTYLDGKLTSKKKSNGTVYIKEQLPGTLEKLYKCNYQEGDTFITQFSTIFSGIESENFCVTPHDCAASRVKACIRNITSRGTYDEQCAINALEWYYKELAPKWASMIVDYLVNDLKFCADVDSKIEYVWLKHYGGGQFAEYFLKLISMYKLKDKIKHKNCMSHVKKEKSYGQAKSKMKMRNITAQQGYGKVLMGPYTDILSHALRKYDYGYNIGLNFETRDAQLRHVLAVMYDPVAISIDGSGYDSTQYDLFKGAIDGMMLTFIMVLTQYDTSYDIDQVLPIFIDQMQSVTTKGMNISYDICGTVGSGYMSTSVGNTMRSLFYIRYGLREFVEQKDYFVFAHGDDVRILCEREKANEIKAKLQEYVYVPDNDDPMLVKGKLGQIAKYIDITEIQYSEYLSTTTLYSRLKRDARTFRRIDRVLASMSYTDTDYIDYKQPGGYERYLHKCIILNVSNYYSILDWGTGVDLFEAIATMYLNNAKLIASRLGIDINMTLEQFCKVRNKNYLRYKSVKWSWDREYRDYLEEKYGITWKQTDEFIKLLVQKRSDPFAIVRSEFIDKIFKKDGTEMVDEIKCNNVAYAKLEDVKLAQPKLTQLHYYTKRDTQLRAYRRMRKSVYNTMYDIHELPGRDFATFCEPTIPYVKKLKNYFVFFVKFSYQNVRIVPGFEYLKIVNEALKRLNTSILYYSDIPFEYSLPYCSISDINIYNMEMIDVCNSESYCHYMKSAENTWYNIAKHASVYFSLPDSYKRFMDYFTSNNMRFDIMEAIINKLRKLKNINLKTFYVDDYDSYTQLETNTILAGKTGTYSSGSDDSDYENQIMYGY